MKTFTDEQLAKLRKYLEDNAKQLANDNNIRQIPYYHNNDKMRDYMWTIINVAGLGQIEMYFTGSSSILKINGIYVERDRVESFNFYQIEQILLVELKNKKIEDSSSFFDKI